MSGAHDPRSPGDRGDSRGRQPFGWRERLILRFIVSSDSREEFVDALLDQWRRQIQPRFGEERARTWLNDQVRAALLPWLSFRLRRAMRTLFGKAVGLLLFAYLLPGIVAGLLLYGVGAVGWPLVDALRNASPPEGGQPRGFARFILYLVVPRRWRDEFLQDLREECALRSKESSPAEVQAWLWGQVRGAVASCLLWRLKRLVKFILSRRFPAWVVLVALCVYLLPALIVVALVTAVGMMLCAFVDKLRRPPWRHDLRLIGKLVRRIVDSIRRFLHRCIGGLVAESSDHHLLGGPRRAALDVLRCASL